MSQKKNQSRSPYTDNESRLSTAKAVKKTKPRKIESMEEYINSKARIGSRIGDKAVQSNPESGYIRRCSPGETFVENVFVDFTGQLNTFHATNTWKVGRKYSLGDDRLAAILDSARVVEIQSNAPVTMGIKLKGIPVNIKPISKYSGDFDILIPAMTNQPTKQKITIFQNSLTADDVITPPQTEDSINASVIKKSDGFFEVHPDSHIAARATELFQNNMVSENEVYPNFNSNDEQKEATILSSALFKQCKKDLLEESKVNPMHDMNNMSAICTRADEKPFSDSFGIQGKYTGSENAYAHVMGKISNVSCRLELTYKIVSINDSDVNY